MVIIRQYTYMPSCGELILSRRKDSPRNIGEKWFSSLSTMVVLMLHICQPIFGTRKAVVLEKDFFVAKVIV